MSFEKDLQAFLNMDEITRNWYRTAAIIKDGIIKNAEAESGVKISTPCLISLGSIQNMIWTLKRGGAIDEQNRLTNMLQCY